MRRESFSWINFMPVWLGLCNHFTIQKLLKINCGKGAKMLGSASLIIILTKGPKWHKFYKNIRKTMEKGKIGVMLSLQIINFFRAWLDSFHFSLRETEPFPPTIMIKNTSEISCFFIQSLTIAFDNKIKLHT